MNTRNQMTAEQPNLSTSDPADRSAQIMLPDVPTMVASHSGSTVLSKDGEILELDKPSSISWLSQTPLVCHAPSISSKLQTGQFIAFDVLELFAFVHPATFCAPSVKGLAEFYGEPIPQESDDEAMMLLTIAENLLRDLQAGRYSDKTDIVGMVGILKEWLWTPFIIKALGLDENAQSSGRYGLKVWKDLPEWSEHAPEPPPGHLPVTEEEATENLKLILSRIEAEARPAQKEYVQKSTHAFTPREDQGKPNIVLAEAGTGTGKTLGYLSGAQIWAQKNEGQVWLSTYTKNLQRQLDQELDKAYPNQLDKRNKTVIRKGRENYLCLLNFEDLVRRAHMPGVALQTKIIAVLIARWVGETRFGDLKGGDLPGWMADLFQKRRLYALSDQRGECIHAACPHFHRCFIEKNIRQSRRAELVVANHALIMVQNALAGEYMDDVRSLPTRYVFDEAHHLFHAADGAFSSHLSGRESLELRRWILGNESGRGFRALRGRGLKNRMDELLGQDEKALKMVGDILFAARDLTSAGWLDRLKDKKPLGPAESFLSEVRLHVLRQCEDQDPLYSIETGKGNIPQSLIQAAHTLQHKLSSMKKTADRLYSYLEDKLNNEADELEASDKQKIEAMARSIQRRLIISLEAWISMLYLIEQETPDAFLDWFVIERSDGYEMDIGFYRHWVDPMEPFVKSLEKQSHGLIFTSATLNASHKKNIDQVEETSAPEPKSTDSQSAFIDAILSDQKKKKSTPQPSRDNFLGLEYFEKTIKPVELSIQSPFDYAKQSKILIINDLNTKNIARVADAYRSLFEASNGGALGLFTAIQRLKGVHEILSPKLEKSGLHLYAQHVDGMEISTLVDLFKLDEKACLLGTDAIRDGVDIPGESLRLLVFDKVPWPRPNLLHKARRKHFGSRVYDEYLTKQKLKQAFGRLIRRQTDRGIFVMLESRLPTRLLDAFPEDAPIERLSLYDALQEIKKFYD